MENNKNLSILFKASVCKSIIIADDTNSLCGKFNMVGDDRYDGPVPVPAGSDGLDNLNFINRLIDNNVEIITISDSAEIEEYWRLVYTYICIKRGVDFIKCFRNISNYKCLYGKKHWEHDTVIKRIIKKNHLFDWGYFNIKYSKKTAESLKNLLPVLCTVKSVCL